MSMQWPVPSQRQDASRKTASRMSLGVICLLASLPFLGAGSFLLIDTLQFLHRATATATGTIVSCRPEKNRSLCIPTVEFTTTQGETVTFTDDPDIVVVGNYGLAVGQQQPVAYNPADPHDARIASFPMLWAGPVGLCGVGGLLFLIALLLLLPGLTNGARSGILCSSHSPDGTTRPVTKHQPRHSPQP